MALRIAQSVLEDLQAIQAHYTKEGVPHIGNEFVAAILEHFEILSLHPDAGRVLPEFGFNHIRELIHTPFRVVYLRQEISVVLIRVWRSEEQLELPD